MIKVLIADDHPLVRAGLKQTIADSGDITVAAEAASAPEALALLHKTKVDVAVLDIVMPGTTGLNLLKQFKIEKPKLPVLMLSVYAEEDYAIRSLRAGAAGYLTKNSAGDELVLAIRKVHNGGRYITGSLAEKLAVEMQTPEEAKLPHETLSDREYETMLLIAKGIKPADMANTLKLSLKTISTYRARLMEKMGLKTNAEVVRYVIEHNLAK